MKRFLSLLVVLVVVILAGCKKESPTETPKPTPTPQVIATATATDTDTEIIKFEKTYGGTGNDLGWFVQQTANGGYIITGSTDSTGAGQNDVYLIKVDGNGNTIWEKTYGGAGWDKGYSVQQTGDGGYIITGYTASTGAGYYDIYLIKVNGSGDLVWEKTYGGSGWDESYSVQQTGDGGYIITGYTTSTGSGGADVYLIKVDVNGNTQWERAYGGASDDYGYSVQQTEDGGYVIAGLTGSTGSGGYDVYLIKVDVNGNTQWERAYGGISDDKGLAVQQTADGGYVIAGITSSTGAGGYDVYLVKADANGNTIWEKTYGGAGDDYGYSVQQTADGGYVIAGYTGSAGAGGYDVYLIKTGGNGSKIWEKTFGGVEDDIGNSVRQTGDGGYIISGYTSSTGAGNADVYLIKTDGSGNSN